MQGIRTCIHRGALGQFAEKTNIACENWWGGKGPTFSRAVIHSTFAIGPTKSRALPDWNAIPCEAREPVRARFR